MVRKRALLLALLSAPLGLLVACAGDDAASSASEASDSDVSSATSTATASTATTAATSGGGSTDASTSGASAGTSGGGETSGSTSGGPAVELAEVGHARELRGAWIASVFNINFPSAPGLDAAAQEAELIALLDASEAAGLNAVFLQVRPECDALYPSALEPWSRSLSGQQGVDPGWDPLAVAIAEGHARGLEVHAWLNPYRAKASKSSQIVPPHVALAHPEHAHDYDKYTWMDPGAAPVQDHLLAVIEDIVSRYPVDGIHFDDYFYPYPDGSDFPDDLTWGDYVDGGGLLGRGDWRRSNVDHMVESVGALLGEVAPDVRFGISPFGIYRPGTPPGIQGFDQYEGLYADPLRWLDEGWVDYLAPQLYWPTTYPQQAYDVLIAWWASETTGGRHIFAGNYLSKLGSAPEWSLEELLLQVELTRDEAASGARGNIFFNIEPLVDDWEGIAGALVDEFYGAPALTPALAAAVAAGEEFDPPHVELAGEVASLAHADADRLRAYVVYAAGRDGWVLDRILPASSGEAILGPGRWAISAAARSGVESLGVVVELP
ncbi:MAG: family 10 glycosylhydrolase [Myxococcales bacterium]|nr:family 10 glycosylhydrolase [Myxococcales bacterium]